MQRDPAWMQRMEMTLWVWGAGGGAHRRHDARRRGPAAHARAVARGAAHAVAAGHAGLVRARSGLLALWLCVHTLMPLDVRSLAPAWRLVLACRCGVAPQRYEAGHC